MLCKTFFFAVQQEILIFYNRIRKFKTISFHVLRNKSKLNRTLHCSFINSANYLSFVRNLKTTPWGKIGQQENALNLTLSFKMLFSLSFRALSIDQDKLDSCHENACSTKKLLSGMQKDTTKRNFLWIIDGSNKKFHSVSWQFLSIYRLVFHHCVRKKK